MSEARTMQRVLEELQQSLYAGNYEQAFAVARQLRESGGEATPPAVLYAGACALFGLGHVLEAQEWVERHGERTRYDADHLYLAAYLELHRQRVDQALLLWTRIIQLNPADTFADSLIERARRGDAALAHELRTAGAFTRFVPLPGAAPGAERREAKARRPRTAAPLVIATVLVLALAAVALGFYFDRIVRLVIGDRFEAALNELPAPPSQGSVLPESAYGDERPRFVYATRDEALAEYNKARQMIGQAQVNRARLALGRIELSNASFEIKERALLLRDAIPLALEAEELRDSVSAAQILKEPYLLRGAQVLWKGRATQVRRSGPALSLRLALVDLPEAEVVALFAGADDEAAPSIQDGDLVQVFGDLGGVRGTRLTVQAREISRISE